jgi:uncharacterized protein YwqG
MDLPTLLTEVSRPCTVFDVGGFRPTNEVQESWLGKVSLYKPDEEVPVDKHGNPMMQLAQFHVPSLPFIPKLLDDIAVLTVFISTQIEGDSELMDGCWEIREYRDINDLVTKDIHHDFPSIKGFPLRPNLIESDHPIWDGGGLSSEQEDAFLELENDGEIEDYYDVTTHTYSHKVGGYPSFCQSGVDLAPYEFIFQISSDEKLQLNIIDGGNLTFWRHPQNGTWKLYYDFY